MLSTMQSGLDHIKEILGTLDQSQVSEVLRIHFKHLIATVQHFSEFALMFQNFPWRFALLLDADEAVVARTARECKEEWDFLLKQEELCADASKCFPLKDVPFVRWYAYREPMTFMEERRFKVDDDVRSLVRAWQADPSSTLGCEDSFRNLRTGERAHGGGEIAPVQLQALSIKGVNERYHENFTTVGVEPSQVHSIPVKTIVKPGIFSAKRATATDTGLPGFSQMVKETTVSPHNLTRKSMNLWKACKDRDGNLSNSWVAELVRPGQEPFLVLCKSVRV